MIQPEIKTKRLLLRPFKLEDAKVVQYLAGNENVSEPTLNIPYPYEDGMAEEWISSQTQSWKNGTGVIYAITDKNLNTLFGNASLVSIKNSQAELGYWVGEPYWKNGYCTEAAKALIEFAFTRLGIVKVVAEHLSSNPASGRVMEKIGMRHVHQIQKIDRNGKKAKIEFYVL